MASEYKIHILPFVVNVHKALVLALPVVPHQVVFMIPPILTDYLEYMSEEPLTPVLNSTHAYGTDLSDRFNVRSLAAGLFIS